MTDGKDVGDDGRRCARGCWLLIGAAMAQYPTPHQDDRAMGRGRRYDKSSGLRRDQKHIGHRWSSPSRRRIRHHGAREAKAAAPDGYTVYAVHDYIHLTFYAGISDVKYSDFEPICLVSATPGADRERQNALEELAGARGRRQEAAGRDHGRRHARLDQPYSRHDREGGRREIQVRVYDGLAPRMNALLGGHSTSRTPTDAEGQDRSRLLRYIAIAREKRDPEAPDVPTLRSSA